MFVFEKKRFFNKCVCWFAVLSIAIKFVHSLNDEFENSCKVTNSKGPQKNKPCVFPFKHKGSVFQECGCILPFNKTHEQECRNKNHPKAKFWCSTKVDENGEHLSGGGNYGFCERECMISSTIKIKDTSNGEKSEINFNVGELTDTEPMHRCGLECIRNASIAVTQLPTSNNKKLETNETNKDVIQSELLKKIQESLETENTNVKPNVATTLKPTPTSDEINNLGSDTTPGFRYDVPSEGTWLPNVNEQECGQTTHSGFTIGGRDARQGEFPYAAAIGFSIEGNYTRAFFICGGTLINKRYVLSAAHCISPGIPGMVISRVVLGLVDLNKVDKPELLTEEEVPQIFYVIRNDVTIHELYAPEDISAGNDIALIRLPRLAKTADEEGKHVSPICLGWNSKIKLPTAQHGQTLVVGWGKRDRFDTLEESGSYSTKLNKVEVPIVGLAICRHKFFNQFNVWQDKHLCAGDEGHDSCQGDSGSPLIIRRDSASPAFLYGIVSFGTKTCGSGVPGVYTRIETYIPWILSHLQP